MIQANAKKCNSYWRETSSYKIVKLLDFIPSDRPMFTGKLLCSGRRNKSLFLHPRYSIYTFIIQIEQGIRVKLDHLFWIRFLFGCKIYISICVFEMIMYFWYLDEIRDMFTKAGLTEEQNLIDRRLQVNRGRQLKMYRVWIQCKYRKPVSKSWR